MRNSNNINISLTHEIARELIEQFSAVLNGDANYLNVELVSDDGIVVSISLEGDTNHG